MGSMDPFVAADAGAFSPLINSIPNPLAEYQKQQAVKLGLEGRALQNQQARVQLGQIAEQAQRQQQFQQAFEQSDGSPQSVAKLMLQFPELSDKLKQSVDVSNTAKNDADRTALSEIYFAGHAGKFDLAAKQARARFEADKAAGMVEPGEEDIVNALESGDPAKQKAVMTMIGGQLYALNPAQFHDVFGGLGEADKGQVVGRSIGHYETAEDGTRKWVVDYRDPDNPEYRTITTTDANGNPVTQIVRVGGDQGGAPTGEPSGVARTHGYTPRQRDGGDNPDNVVDNKIAALSKAVGVDPDTPMTRQQFAAFVQALPGTENAKGNNPGGIKDGAYAKAQPGYAGAIGQYAKFATPGAGQAAMQKLLTQSYFNRGQQSIRDIIEGRPSGGGQARGGAPVQSSDPGVVYSVTGHAKGNAPVPGNSDLTGPAYLGDLQRTNPSLAAQVQGVLETRLAYPPATARSPQAQQLRAAVLQVDPSYDEQAYKRRQTTIQQYTPGHSGPGASMLSAATLINHMYDLAQAARDLPDYMTAFQNSLSALGARATNAPWLIKFNEGRKFVSSELPKFLNGKAPTEGEQRDHYNSYDPSKGKSGIQTALSTDVDYLYGRYEPLIQAYKDNTGKDLNIDSYAPGTQTKAKAAALEYYRSNGALPTVISNPSQAAKLPHGAVFVTPDGRVLKRR